MQLAGLSQELFVAASSVFLVSLELLKETPFSTVARGFQHFSSLTGERIFSWCDYTILPAITAEEMVKIASGA